MSRLTGALCLALLLSAAVQAAPETVYVRALPSVPLLSSPSADAIVVRRLTPGDALVVVGRQPGYVNVQLADAVQGWLQESNITTSAPPAARVTELEQALADGRAALATAQTQLTATQAQLRQAQQAASAARTSGAGRAEALEAENEQLRSQLAAAETELAGLRARVAELEMAQQMSQDAARLLAARKPVSADAPARRFTVGEIALAAGAVAILALLTGWLGYGSARRRLRQRYHGLDL